MQITQSERLILRIWQRKDVDAALALWGHPERTLGFAYLGWVLGWVLV